MGAGPYEMVDPIYTGLYHQITLVPSEARAEDRHSVDDKDWSLRLLVLSSCGVCVGVEEVKVDEDEGYCSHTVLADINQYRLRFEKTANSSDDWTLPSFIARENDYITLRVSRRLTWVEA
jgi:hypothetical protein